MTRAGAEARPRPVWLVGLLVAVLVGLSLAVAGLGVWQLQRLAWKQDLIARVTARLAEDPVPAPGPAGWTAITGDADEYRRVTVTGVFDHPASVLVQAVTEQGGGFWLMTSLTTRDGWTVLVNRGFVPADRRDGADLSAGPQTIAGLLRLTEPGGGFLRQNDPGADRWYSRDVAAIAAARGLGPVAPYFIDAGAGPDPAALPIGGLTVIAFRNHHLGYALTWFVLAAGGLGIAGWFARYEWHLRRGAARLATDPPKGPPAA